MVTLFGTGRNDDFVKVNFIGKYLVNGALNAAIGKRIRTAISFDVHILGQLDMEMGYENNII